MSTMAAPSVLITGFGPFPKMPSNPSAHLAEHLGRRLQTRAGLAGQIAEAQTAILPTEWHTIAEALPPLLDAQKPDIALHFGVCRAAHAIRIERSAFNATSRMKDAAGNHAGARKIIPDGPPRLDTALPTAALARLLRTRGHPALPSLSPGRYLCNALYYLSLAHAARQMRAPLTLFVHIPPTTAQGGIYSETGLADAAWHLLHDLLQQHAKRALGDQAARHVSDIQAA